MTERDTSAIETADSSSSMVALRTIVMIAFLVAIPLMAVIGAGLPDSLRNAMQGDSARSHAAAAAARPNETQPGATALADSSAATEPLLEPGERTLPAPAPGGSIENARPAGEQPGMPPPTAAMAPNFNRAPRASITEVRTSAGGAPRARIVQVRAVDDSTTLQAPAPAPTAPLWAPAPRTAASPRGRNTTAHFEPSEVRPRAPQRKAPKRNIPDAALQATAYSTPAAPWAKSASAEDQPPPASDAFARGEQRLRQYGATHYRLESWGENGELFRCSANVALPNHRYGARHFETTAASPSQAIDRLLEQVESWRAAQRLSD
jgi:hypothetical protein